MMLDPLDFKNRPFIARLRTKRRIAALILLLENAAQALWRIGSWAALFAGLWLMQFPAFFGKMGPEIFFFLFLGGLFWLCHKDLPRLRWPDKRAIDHRIEQASGLTHRPIAALEDRLANPQKEPTRKMWQHSRNRALDAIKAIKLPRLQKLLPAADPAALRAAAMLVLVAGLAIAGPQAPERLKAGAFPFAARWTQEAMDRVTLWVNPPAYTGIGQITVQGVGSRKEAVGIPEGSTIKARVAGGMFQPVLMIGEQKLPLASTGKKNWATETAAQDVDVLTLRQWPFFKLELPVHYIADLPPEIDLTDEPLSLPKGQLQIPLAVKDDYSVTDIRMMLTLDPSIDDAPLGRPVEDKRAVMSPPQTETGIKPVYDLAWHPWAGLSVVLLMTAEDHADHVTALPPIKMTLPEREFLNPAAKKVINMRKRLIWTPDASAENVGYELEELLSDLDAYNGDPIVFLSLRSASSRLLRSTKDPETAPAVIEQLWDTALRIEDGNLSLAARNLRDAQRVLEKLLADPNASQQDIAIAMEELRMAMAEYFKEVYQEMQKRMAKGDNTPRLSPEMFNNTMDADDLAAFMDQLQSQALTGDRDAARQMLSQLEQMMNSLDPSMSFEMPEDMKFMMKGVSELQKLIEKQKELLDQTQKQAQENGAQQKYPEFLPLERKDGAQPWERDPLPPPPQLTAPPEGKKPPVNTQANKTEQDALRYVLGQLMLEADEQLGEIPETMQMAEQEMRGSADRLGVNDPDGSIPRQEKAIEYLQQSMNDMSQQLQQRMQQMTLMSFGAGRMDPLGRPMDNGNGPNFMPGSKVKIPDKAERKKVQDILKTLRERSGELSRPEYELEYFRRLMKQF